MPEKTLRFGVSEGKKLLEWMKRHCKHLIDTKEHGDLAYAFAELLEGAKPDVHIESDIGEFEVIEFARPDIDGSLIKYESGKGFYIAWCWVPAPKSEEFEDLARELARYGFLD